MNITKSFFMVFFSVIHGVIMIICYYNITVTSNKILRNLRSKKTPDSEAEQLKAKQENKINIVSTVMFHQSNAKSTNVIYRNLRK